jgi:hypothetical protein
VKKQKEIMAFLAIASIGLAAFFIPAVSADGGGAVYTEVSVYPETINLGENTTVTLRAFTNVTTAGAAYLVLPDNVEYVEGSASITPDIVGQTLEWGISDLTPAEPWTVSFDVKPENPGKLSVNMVNDSKVTYESENITYTVVRDADNTIKFEEADLGLSEGIDTFIVHVTGGSDTVTVEIKATPSHASATLTGVGSAVDLLGFKVKLVSIEGNTYTLEVISLSNKHDLSHFKVDFEGTVQDPAGSTTVVRTAYVPFPALFVDVKTPPVADFEWTPDKPEADQDVTFTANASDPDNLDGGGITNYTWDFGDGTEPVKTVTETVTHAFGLEGDYNVTLTVTDDEGKTASVTKTVNVSSVPPPPAAEGITITLPDDEEPYIGQQITIGLNFTNGVGKSASLTVDDECTIWSVESLPSNETTIIWLPMSSGKHTLGAYLNGTEYDNATVTVYIGEVE